MEEEGKVAGIYIRGVRILIRTRNFTQCDII